MAFHIVVQNSQVSGQNTFVIKNLASLALDLSTPLTPMPLPEEGAEENILVKMEGNTKTIPISWTMMEEGGVIGTGFTYGGGVWTLQGDEGTQTSLEQIQFWDEFAPRGIADGYSFQIFQDGFSSAVYSEDGSITKVRFNISGASPVVWDAHLDFIVGSTIAAFDSNSPERPTLTALTSPLAGQIKVFWKPFDDYVSGEAPTLTNHLIRYKKSKGGVWIDLFPNPAQALDTADDYLITGLDSGEYIVKVASENLESAGTLIRNYSFRRRVVVA